MAAARGKGVLICSYWPPILRTKKTGQSWRPFQSYYSRLWLQGTRNSFSPLASWQEPVIPAQSDHVGVCSAGINKNYLNYYIKNSFTKTEKWLKSSFVRDLTSNDDKNVEFEKENIWTIPNLLTMSRIAAAPALGCLVVTEHYMAAFGLFVAASVTDFFDGIIARTFPSQSSRLGSILDPLADKCLVSVVYLTLTYMKLIPLPLTLLILSRDLVLVGGSFYLRYLTLPPPKTWRKFWDVERSAVQVTPNLLSKVNTLMQLTLVGLTLGAPVLHYVDHPFLQALWYITGFTTIASGLCYCIQMEGFKIVKKKRKSRKQQ